MNILWFTNIMLPEYSRALGRAGYNSGGWMSALVDAFRRYAPDIHLTVVCQGCDKPAFVDGVNYCSLSFLGGPGQNRSWKKGDIGLKAAMKYTIESIKPDLIHFHGTESGFQAYYRELKIGIPTITSLQGIIAGYLPHIYGGLTPKQLSRHRNWFHLIRRNSFEQYGLRYERRAACERLILSNGGHFCGRTDWDRAWVRAMNPCAKYHYVGEVLRKPFYDNKYRDPLKIRPHSIYAGACLGSMLKGGHYLLESISLLKSRFPDVKVYIANSERLMKTDWRTMIVRSDYERYLCALIKELKVESNVVFLPSLSAEDVADMLLESEVFVLPSLIENSPNSLGEAMMLKTPIVATDVGGVNSMINGSACRLIHSCDIAELTEAISDVFEHTDEAKKRSVNAKMMATERFNPLKIVNDMRSAYCSSISSHDEK